MLWKSCFQAGFHRLSLWKVQYPERKRQLFAIAAER